MSLDVVMSSIIPFLGNDIFEPTVIKIMSDAYNNAMDDIYGFGHPNKIVGQLIAARIIELTKSGECDTDRLCGKALAACGFSQACAR